MLFAVLEGRDGQVWRAILLLTPVLFLVAGLVLVVASEPVGWIGGVIGAGGLIASSIALALRRRRTAPVLISPGVATSTSDDLQGSSSSCR